MIKINLLGVAPPPTPTAEGPPATRAFQVGVFVGALVVSFAIVGLVWKMWSSTVADLDRKVKLEQVREQELKAVKNQNDQYQARLRDLEQRINTIQTLQAGRVGPVEEMTALGDVVNRVSDLYLFTVVSQGDRMVLNGQTASVESMANFLSSLQKSAYFEDVQLRRFFQDNLRSQLSYKFTLDMIYKSPTAAPAAGQTTPPAGAAAPARRAGM
jgi:Tfp pilus assembly protein PilN